MWRAMVLCFAAAVEKVLLGSGCKNNIFYIMRRDISSEVAAMRLLWLELQVITHVR